MKLAIPPDSITDIPTPYHINLEKPEALTTLRRNMINYLNIRSLGHLPCHPESARSGQEVRFFH